MNPERQIASAPVIVYMQRTPDVAMAQPIMDGCGQRAAR
jgi:hypothetical protein